MKNTKPQIAIHWFRRDLRLEDNKGLEMALESGFEVLPIFIFDDQITKNLPENDARISFIYQLLSKINYQLHANNSSLHLFKGKPSEIWKEILDKYDVKKVFATKDYEPYAIKRDLEIKSLLAIQGIEFEQIKDQVIFGEKEIVKSDGLPYTIYTPYKNKWLTQFQSLTISKPTPIDFSKFIQVSKPLQSLEQLGFEQSTHKVQDFNLSQLSDYESKRNFPSQDATSYLSPHLRFGSVSVRQLISSIGENNTFFLSELIWREFFMQILFNFPHVVNQSFNPKFRNIEWRNKEDEFERWCAGTTGYPMVDAGMRQLNATGYMHNRVRMVVASFLCKHLLIDWQWGEAYFAEKLLDYDLSANNGNWQWAAGTGCDAAPYFRVFNPTEQIKKFDPQLKYIKKWVPDLNSFSYPQPMVEHSFARNRALETYKKSLVPH